MSNRTLIMGVLNVTPDSFSDGGRFLDIENALKRVAKMRSQGMDILDIGGESTRPGHSKVEVEEEWQRIGRIIHAVRQAWPELPISVDTWKPRVAELAVEAGATWINDVWGGRRSEFYPEEQDAVGMAGVMAAAGGPVILMHNRPAPEYRSFWPEVLADFQRMLDLALAAGVSKDLIWLDPGFGFGKTPAHNLEILKNLDRIVALGFPVLLGTSRKSTIGQVLNKPVDQRLWGTAATVAWGIARGCRMIRVHDIEEMSQVVRMCEAIQQGIQWQPTENG